MQSAHTIYLTLFCLMGGYLPIGHASKRLEEILQTPIAEKEKTQNIAKLASKKTILKAVDQAGNTMLHLVISTQNHALSKQEQSRISRQRAQILIEAGININARNKKGQTALDFAIRYGYEEVALYLLATGKAQLTLCTQGEYTTLQILAWYPNLKVLQAMGVGVLSLAAQTTGRRLIHLLVNHLVEEKISDPMKERVIACLQYAILYATPNDINPYKAIDAPLELLLRANLTVEKKYNLALRLLKKGALAKNLSDEALLILIVEEQHDILDLLKGYGLPATRIEQVSKHLALTYQNPFLTSSHP